MSAVLLVGLKVGYLALLWLFVLFVALTIRRDLVGQSVGIRRGERRRRNKESRSEAKSRRKDLTRLKVIAGPLEGTTVELPPQMVIGRSTGTGFDIDDDYASGSHARLTREPDGRWVIEDLQSTNGTYVNEGKVSQPTYVGLADTIRIGRTQMKLER